LLTVSPAAFAHFSIAREDGLSYRLNLLRD
jgi:hypothetical protein